MKTLVSTMGIKHRADGGFRKFCAIRKFRFGRKEKCFEMPYVSYPRPLAFMQGNRNDIDKLMKTQRTNSTFASSNTQADSSACKRAIFYPTHLSK